MSCWSPYAFLPALASVCIASPARADELEDARAFLQRSELVQFATRTVTADGPGNYKVDVGDPKVSLWIVKRADWLAVLLANRPEALNIASLVPSSVVGAAGTKTVFMVIGASGGSLEPSGLPSALEKAVKRAKSGAAVPYVAGVNLYAELVVGSDGALGQLVQAGLFPRAPVWITGSIGGAAVEALFGRGGGGGAPDLALTVSTESLTPAPFASLASPKLTLGAATFSITKQGDALTLSGQQRDSLFVVGKTRFPIPVTTLSFATDTASGGYVISVEGRTDKRQTVNDAFAIPGLEVQSLGIGGTITKTPRKGGASVGGFGLDISARVVIAKKTYDGTFSASVESGAVTDLSLALAGELPVGALLKVPAAKDLALARLMVGINPSTGEGYLGGSLTLAGMSADAVLVAKGAPTLFARVAKLDLGALVNAKELVKVPVLDAVVVIGSAARAQQSVGELPVPVRAMIRDITGSDLGTLDVVTGMSVLTKVQGGVLGVDKLGVGETLVLGGSIDVKVPSFKLRAKLSRVPTIPGLPPGLAFEAPEVLVGLSKKDTGPVFELGLGLTLKVPVPPDLLVMQGVLSINTAGSLAFAGQLVSDWNKPLALGEVIVLASPQAPLKAVLGVNVDGSIDLGFQGAAKIGALRYGPVALCVNIQAAPPVPKKIAFAFKGDEFGPNAQVAMMTSLVKSAVNGPLKNGIDDPKVRADLAKAGPAMDAFAKMVEGYPLADFKFTDVDAYLATPAVTCDIPAITGMGVRLAGKASFMGQRLGEVESWVNLDQGLKMYANISPFTFKKLITLNKALLDVLLPIPGMTGLAKDPGHFYLAGDTAVLTFKGRVEMSLDKKGASFEMASSVADLGNFAIEARTVGKSLADVTDFRLGLKAGGGAEQAFARKLGEALAATAATRRAATEAGKSKGKEDKEAAQAEYEALDRTIGKKYREAKADLKAARKDVRKARKDLRKAKKKCKEDLGIAEALCDVLDAAQAALEVAQDKKGVADNVLAALKKGAEFGNYTAAKARLESIELEQKAFGAVMSAWAEVDSIGAKMQKGIDNGIVVIDELALDGSLAKAQAKLSVDLEVGGSPVEAEYELNLMETSPLALLELADDIATEIRDQATTEGSPVWKALKKKK